MSLSTRRRTSLQEVLDATRASHPKMGPNFLRDVWFKYFDKVGKAFADFGVDPRLNNLKLLEQFLSREEFTLGTACSGTDGVVFVSRAFVQALRDLGIHAKFKHMFSCEYDVQKQGWIRVTCPNLLQLFADITKLGAAVAENILNDDREEIIPRVLMFVAGFTRGIPG